MRILLLLSILSLFCSCATRKTGNEFQTLEFTSTKHYDVTDQTIYVTYIYPNVQEQYFEHEKNNRINKDSSFSCFDSKDSVNFINIHVRDVIQYRQFVTPSKYEAVYKTVNVLHNGHYRNIHVEQRVNKLMIDQKVCHKRVGEEVVMVVSELYSYKE